MSAEDDETQENNLLRCSSEGLPRQISIITKRYLIDLVVKQMVGQAFFPFPLNSSLLLPQSKYHSVISFLSLSYEYCFFFFYATCPVSFCNLSHSLLPFQCLPFYFHLLFIHLFLPFSLSLLFLLLPFTITVLHSNRVKGKKNIKKTVK